VLPVPDNNRLPLSLADGLRHALPEGPRGYLVTGDGKRRTRNDDDGQAHTVMNFQ
jgi:hypothetical protein